MATERPDFVSKLGLAFLAHRLRRASELILETSAMVLRRRALEVPSRSGSTIALLHGEGVKSITEIAFQLQLSHPLIIKLCDRLIKADLAVDRPDARDARRRLIELTPRGHEMAEALGRYWQSLAESFSEMFDEEGIDLFAAIQAFERAAEREPIWKRVERRLDQIMEAQQEKS
jgi:DNA-binding MarR family transcriptional regulator